MVYIPNEHNVRPTFNYQVYTAMEFNLAISRPLHIYVLVRDPSEDISFYKQFTPHVHSMQNYTTDVEPRSIIVWIENGIVIDKSDWHLMLARMLNGFLDVVELCSHYVIDGKKTTSIGYQNMTGLPIRDVKVRAIGFLSEITMETLDFRDDLRWGYIPGLSHLPFDQ